MSISHFLQHRRQRPSLFTRERSSTTSLAMPTIILQGCLETHRRTVCKAIQSLTGVAHVSYVCNNCICFVECPEELSCPSRGEPRYHRAGHKDVPRKTFDYIPVQHRLHLLYSDPKAARQPKSYHKKLEDTAEGDVLQDFWDTKLCTELKKGILTDPRSLAFYFSTDGVCLFRKGRQHIVHPLINYNLHPELRFRKEIICLGIIPSPKKPKACSLSCALWLASSRYSP